MLYLGNKANSCTPIKVGDELGRIVEVAATHYNHISAAITQVTTRAYTKINLGGTKYARSEKNVVSPRSSWRGGGAKF